MAQLQIPPSIDDLRSQSLLVTIERLDALDLTPLLVYRLDSAPDSALIFLAWQFDMLDPQWQLAASSSGESIDALTDIDTLTDVDTLLSSSSSAGPTDFDSWRALLQTSIPLHRVHGTSYSIRQALASLNWNSVSFLEGQASWGGSAWPSSEGWAVFRVMVNLETGQTVGANDAARIVAAVNFFKPAQKLARRAGVRSAAAQRRGTGAKRLYRHGRQRSRTERPADRAIGAVDRAAGDRTGIQPALLPYRDKIRRQPAGGGRLGRGRQRSADLGKRVKQ